MNDTRGVVRHRQSAVSKTTMISKLYQKPIKKVLKRENVFPTSSKNTEQNMRKARKCKLK